LQSGSTQPSTPTTDRTEALPALLKFKPITPGRRHLRLPNNPHVYTGLPYKALTYHKKGHAKGGRNNTGRITVRHRGGGLPIRIRTVDFERRAPGPHVVERIEFDPNRSAHLALLASEATGAKSYMVAAVGMRAGDVVTSYRAGLPRSLMEAMGGAIDPGMLAARICVRGNCLPVRLVPPGTQVYCIGSAEKRGAVFARSAGTFATVIGRDASRGEGEEAFKWMVVKLSSGETRRVSKDACATIGVASNPMWQFQNLGKAGRARWMNRRPSVRGVAMNAC
jgi:ribosomal protein L2